MKAIHVIVLIIALVVGLVVIGIRSARKPDISSDVSPGGSEATHVELPPAVNIEDDTSIPLTRPAEVPAGKKSMPPPTKEDVKAAREAGTRHAVIVTSKGTIEADLYGADMPLTVASFVKLANAKFYNGLTFHRVEPDFVIQGGDPAGNGSGGAGYEIKLEISPKHEHELGALAMARTEDPNSAGSQFYIVLNPEKASHLNGAYAVFGKVTQGMEVAQKIAVGDKIISVTIK